MKAISSLVNVDSIDNDKNLEGGFSAESINDKKRNVFIIDFRFFADN